MPGVDGKATWSLRYLEYVSYGASAPTRFHQVLAKGVRSVRLQIIRRIAFPFAQGALLLVSGQLSKESPQDWLLEKFPRGQEFYLAAFHNEPP